MQSTPSTCIPVALTLDDCPALTNRTPDPLLHPRRRALASLLSSGHSSAQQQTSARQTSVPLLTWPHEAWVEHSRTAAAAAASPAIATARAAIATAHDASSSTEGSYVPQQQYDAVQEAHHELWLSSPLLHRTYEFLGYTTAAPHLPRYRHARTGRLFRLNLDKPKKAGR